MEKIITALYDEKKLTGEYFFEALSNTGQPEACFFALNEIQLFEHLDGMLPDILILHLRPDKREHRELIIRLRTKFPGVSLLVMLINYEPTPGEVFNLVAAGARGIIPDSYSREDVMHAMEEVVAYGIHTNYLCPGDLFELSRRKGNWHPAGDTRNSFTEREARIVELKKKGKTSVEVGELLHISDRTVDNTLNKLYERFNCRNMIELIAVYDQYNTGKSVRPEPKKQAHM